MLSDTKKEYFEKLLSHMLDEILTVDSRSMNKPDGSKVTQSDPSDRAVAELESTFSFRMKERKGGLIRKIEEALERIEDGTYGICEECEKVISEKRLKARPVTTLCIECKREQEEHERPREL